MVVFFLLFFTELTFFLLTQISQIKDFEATIAELEVEIESDQNKWLRMQCNIVGMSEKLTQLLNDSHLARQRTLNSPIYTK